MGLIKRIENGTTTTKDADTVRKLTNRILGLFISGIGVGVLLVTVLLYLFGD